MVKIVGIDPGLAATGVGVVCGIDIKVKSFSYGSINTSKEKPLHQRLHYIFSKITLVLEDEKPDLMVVEDLFSFEKYPKSGIILGKVAGVILLAACRADVSVVEVPVREAKQILTGNGNAGKAQLEKSVREFLNLSKPIRPFHASDALGMALIGLFRYRAIQRGI
jgi:crossover junction endodeoxyribonuclease RuvC